MKTYSLPEASALLGVDLFILVNAVYEGKLRTHAAHLPNQTAPVFSESEIFRYKSVLSGKQPPAPKKSLDWSPVQSLADEYCSILKATGAGTELKNRTSRQQDIASEIVERTLPFMRAIGKWLKYGKYDKETGARHRYESLFNNKATLRGFPCELEDLVQDAAINVYIHLQDYAKLSPKECGIATLIHHRAVAAMVGGFAKQVGAEYSTYIIGKAKKALRKTGRDREKFVALLSGWNGYTKRPFGLRRASLLYAAVTGDTLQIIHQNKPDIDGEEDEMLGMYERWETAEMQTEAIMYTPEKIFAAAATEEDEEGISADEIKEAITPEEVALYILQDVETRRALQTLTPREEKVLRLRFGVGEKSDYTHEEIGQEFSVTKERIRQIEAKALRKLRHPSRAGNLRGFFE